MILIICTAMNFYICGVKASSLVRSFNKESYSCDNFHTKNVKISFNSLQLAFSKGNYSCGKFHTQCVKAPGSIWNFNRQKSQLWKISRPGFERVWLIYNFWRAMTKIITVMRIPTLMVWKSHVQFYICLIYAGIDNWVNNT